MEKKLLHSSLIAWGYLFGTGPVRPAPIRLSTLPSKVFKNNSLNNINKKILTGNSDAKLNSSSDFSYFLTSPFVHDIIAADAGSRHFCALTSNGDIILMGSNRYGQVGQPVTTTSVSSIIAEPSLNNNSNNNNTIYPENRPFFYQIDYSAVYNKENGIYNKNDVNQINIKDSYDNFSNVNDDNKPNSIACGTNYSLIYRKTKITGDIRNDNKIKYNMCNHVIAIGNNHMGQLGLGHKDICDNKEEEGFSEWDPEMKWACRVNNTEEGYGNNSSKLTNDAELGIEKIVCGHNHTIIMFNSGQIYACGSNLSGELGIGSTVSPFTPYRISFFDDVPRKSKIDQIDNRRDLNSLTSSSLRINNYNGSKNRVNIRQIAAGGSFTLFLTEEGKVYGCGSNNNNKIPNISATPELIPLKRGFCSNLASLRRLSINTEDSKCKNKNNEIVIKDATNNANKIMRIKHIAAMSEMSVYVTYRNEIFVQGSIEEIGFMTGAKLYQILPLVEDDGSCKHIMKNDDERETDNKSSLPVGCHPPIAKVDAAYDNCYVTYEDGRVVGFGSNTQWQIKTIFNDVKSSDDYNKSKRIKLTNISPSICMERVSLVLPSPYLRRKIEETKEKNLNNNSSSKSSSIVCSEYNRIGEGNKIDVGYFKLDSNIKCYPQIAIGTHFALALDISDKCLYENALVDYYRMERARRKAEGKHTEEVVMREIPFPPQSRSQTGFSPSSSSISGHKLHKGVNDGKNKDLLKKFFLQKK